jgi:probable phosphoglycerate mutase
MSDGTVPARLPPLPALGLDAIRALAAREPLGLAVEAFLFLRHGETEGNRLRFYQPAEQPLNERGLAQAQAAAALLAGEPIDRVAASTMPRAWRTAEIVAAPRGLAVEPVEGLRERWFGDLAGTAFAQVDWAASPPGGETPEGFVARARAGLAGALAPGGRRLLVSHGGVLEVLAAALRVDLPTDLHRNATPLRFARGADGAWRAAALGEVPGGGAAGSEGGAS